MSENLILFLLPYATVLKASSLLKALKVLLILAA